MISNESLQAYHQVQRNENVRAFGAAVIAGTAALFAAQVITGGVATGALVVGLFTYFGFEIDEYTAWIPTDKETIEHLKPVQTKSKTLSKFFSGLALLAATLFLLAWFQGAWAYIVVSSIGFALPIFGLKKCNDSVNYIQRVCNRAESKDKYANSVNTEKQAIAQLQNQCRDYPNLLQKIEKLTSCTHDYPLNSGHRTISDTYAASQQGRPDTLVTLQWVHKKLEKLAHAADVNKPQIAERLETKLASPQYSDKFIR